MVLDHSHYLLSMHKIFLFFYRINYYFLLDAVILLVIICTIKSVDDGLLRISSGCATPSSSLTIYNDSLKFNVITVCENHVNILCQQFIMLTIIISDYNHG